MLCKRHTPLIFIIFFLAVTSQVLASNVTFEDAFSPRQKATQLVIKVIDESKIYIHVAAYSFTSQPIAEALVAAHNRGVDVKIVIDKSQRHGRIIHYFMDQHIPTRINNHYAIMHNKFMVADDDVLELGSFNYTKAAEEKNAENVLVIHGMPTIIQDYNRQWEKLWRETK